MTLTINLYKKCELLAKIVIELIWRTIFGISYLN